MARYAFGQSHRGRSRLPRRLLYLAISILAVLAVGTIIVRGVYSKGLGPVSKDQTTQVFTVRMGSSVKVIADDLQQKHLIKSAWAMQRYVHSKELEDKLQAGTYAFSPSQGTAAIVSTLTKGKVSTNLITILPGRRIDQVRADLINDGFAPVDVDKALEPAQYTDVPVLSFKPASVPTLEGLLWPDSYQKDAGTSASAIIRESLVAMGEHLTAEVQQAFAAQGLSPYQGLTLASIVTQEVNKPTDQAQAAQVFLTRIKMGMMLGSDVTANYGAIISGRAPNLNYDSPYNTLQHPGLPPGPISTVTLSSINATTHPAATDWVYFVAGDDGTTYFSKTLEEHQALTEKYCHKLCGR
jgi:UPF0755 protein